MFTQTDINKLFSASWRLRGLAVKPTYLIDSNVNVTRYFCIFLAFERAMLELNVEIFLMISNILSVRLY